MGLGEKRNRIYGLDLLKAFAVFFVLVFHVNNYCMHTNWNGGFSTITSFPFWLLEGITVPAVDIFVLIGSYLMLDKDKIKLSNYFRIYFSASLIGITGLIVALFTLKIESTFSLLSCLFPFLFKGFWYVSIYLLLMMISPFLNMFIERLDKSRLLYVTLFISTVVVILPTFVPAAIVSSANWGESRLPLFICLYFVAACIKKFELLNKSKIIGLVLWAVSALILIFGGWGISFFANNRGGLFLESYDILFSYSSIFVVTEAIGLFLFFGKLKNGSSFARKLTSTISGCSLIIYIYHMHPIIKNYYVEWRLLGWMNIENSLIFFLEVIGIAVLMLVVGLTAGTIINRIVSAVSNVIISFVKKHNRLVYLLDKIGIACK